MATTQTRPRRPAPPKTEARRAEAPAKRSLPPLATSVVGSYSVPEWLERLKTDYYQRRISRAYLHEIYEVAIKAALKFGRGLAPEGGSAARRAFFPVTGHAP